MSQPGISLNQGMRIAKALLASYLLTGGLLLLLAGLLYRFRLDEGKVQIGIILIYILSCFAGGFLAGMLDDLLDVRSDVVLNGMVPSAQRATLVSVSSLTFSLVMLAAAPLMGALFGAL